MGEGAWCCQVSEAGYACGCARPHSPEVDQLRVDRERVTREALAIGERLLEVKAENQRFKMKLADAEGAKRENYATLDFLRKEFEFCKREIARLDPRLAAARWGKR